MMRTTLCVSAIALMGLAACSTPGINYETRLMPASVDAAATRVVQVDRFRGPGGGWYTARFESMLANTTLDGQPWFQLADFIYDDLGESRAGTYTGNINIIDHRVSEYYRTVSKCVEWDGLFDCETRIDVEELCIREEVEVAVEPRLIDVDSGQTVFSGVYAGTASDEICEEPHRHRGHHGRGGGLFSFGGFTPDPSLVYSALSETLRPIRYDIAPRNATVKATFVTEALDPVVAADPRFEQAVDMAANDPFGSCNTWTALADQYPEAPAVMHNMGACAEASTDFDAAHGLYARAAELSVKYSADGTSAGGAFLKALRKMSDQRYGLELIEELSNPGDYIPVPEVPPES